MERVVAQNRARPRARKVALGSRVLEHASRPPARTPELLIEKLNYARPHHSDG